MFRNFYILFIVFVFLLTIQNRDVIAQEEDSLQWISKFYGIGWPYGNCTQMPSNPSYTINCDSSGRTIEINLYLGIIGDYGPPDPTLPYLDLPYLKKFSINNELTSTGILYPSNILDKFTNITRLEQLSYIGSTLITSIPDQIFQNNINLYELSLSNLYNLRNISFVNSKATNISYLYIIGSPLESIEFGSFVYSKLAHLLFTFKGDFALNFSETQFPMINVLSLSSLRSSSVSNFTINSSTLEFFQVDGAFQQINIDPNCTNMIVITLYPNGVNGTGLINFSKPLYQSFPKLQSLNTNYLITNNYPSLSNLSKVDSVIDYGSFGNTLPDIPDTARWITFREEGITQFPTPFLNGSEYYASLNFGNNYNLSGVVPDVFCNAEQFDLNGTNISVIPDCMTCHYPYLLENRKLPLMVPTPQVSPSCNFTVWPTKYISQGISITITGSSLGWLFNLSDISPGLTTLKANVEYEYKLPYEYQFTSNSTIVYFSYEYNLFANISWEYSFNQLSFISFDQIPGGLVRFLVNGKFATSIPTIGQISTINGVKDIPVTFVNNSLAVVTISQSELLLTVSKLQINNTYSVPYLSFIYIQQFPRVVEISNTVPNTNITVGSTIVVNGTFSQDYHNMTKITLNNNSTLECIIQTTSPSSVTCQLPPSVKVGLSSLQVDVAGFTTPIQYFLVQPDSSNPPPSCLNNCSNNGICNIIGECDCYPEYSGEACQYLNNNNGTNFIPNLNDTTASFESNGYQFNFTLVSIQELDIRDSIVTELLTNNWTSITTDSSINTTIQYSLVYPRSPRVTLAVNASIIFTKQPSSYIYGGVNNSISSNSLKISVSINNWRYQSPLNRLRVVFKTNIESKSDDCGNVLSESSLLYNQVTNGLKYLKVQKNGIVFFGSFSDIVVVNNRPVYTVNQLINQTTPDTNGQSNIYIGVILPYCQQCLIDPDFSALIDSNSPSTTSQCETTKKNNTWRIVVGVVVGGLAAIAIAIGSYITIKKNRKNHRDSKKMENKLKSLG